MNNSKNAFHSMLANFSSMYFARFKNLISMPDQRELLIAAIVQYLSEWENCEWIDEEKIEFLGRDISRVSPIDFLLEINAKINSEINNESVKCAFREKQIDLASNSITNSLPTNAELQKGLLLIRNSTPKATFNEVRVLLDKYLAFYKSTGFYQPVGFALNAIFKEAQENSNINYGVFHCILDTTIRELFYIDATDSRLWIRWSASFLKMKSSDLAELLLWEAFRRHPDNAYIAFALLKTFSHSDYDYQNRIRFCDMARKRFYFNRHLELESARLNGYSNIFDQVKVGILALTKLIKMVDKVIYENTLLASIINKNWDQIKNSEYLPDMLNIINKNMNKKPRLISALSFRLYKYHGQLEPAEAILRSRISFSNSNKEKEIYTNALAKILTLTGDEKQINKAVSLLREFSNIVTKTHLAKLLFERNNEHDWEEAETILRSNLKEDPINEHVITQLASLLMNYGENRKIEAIELLSPHVDESERIKLLLQKIQLNQFDRVDEDSFKEDFEDIPDDNLERIGEDGFEELIDGISYDNAIDMHPYSDWRYEEPEPIDLDPSIVINGRLRKLKFESEYGTIESSKIAKNELMSRAFIPKTEYVSFIYGLYSRSPDEDSSVGEFGAKLLNAYKQANIAVLNEIGDEIPRLGIVVTFAKASLGDQSAINSLNHHLKSHDAETLPWERSLIARISRSNYGKHIIRDVERNADANSNFENLSRFSDVIGSLITLESIAA